MIEKDMGIPKYKDIQKRQRQRSQQPVASNDLVTPQEKQITSAEHSENGKEPTPLNIMIENEDSDSPEQEKEEKPEPKPKKHKISDKEAISNIIQDHV